MLLVESNSGKCVSRAFSVRRLANLLALIIPLLANLLMPLSGRAQTNISEFPIPSNPYVVPFGITYGPDGQFWFTELYASRIGSIDTISNHVQDVLVTNFGSAPFGIVTGPDNNIWFTISASNQLARYSIANTNYVTFQLPPGQTTNVQPSKLVVGPDGNFWFLERGVNMIGCMSPNPTLNSTNTNVVALIHQYGPFDTNSQLYGLAFSPDGSLWFTEVTYGKIRRLDPNTGSFQIFYTPNTNCGPYSIIPGPDGAMWFTEYGTNRIGRITSSGAITEFDLPYVQGAIDPGPLDIIVGADGNLWFTEYMGSAIGKIKTNGIVTIFPTPTGGSFPTYMATGPANIESNIWFCENVNGPAGVGNSLYNIGRLNLAEALDLATPTTLSFPAGSTVISNMATFKTSRLINNITLNWGDGNVTTLAVNSLTNTGGFVTNTPYDSNSFIIVTCVTPPDTNFNAGTYNIAYTHHYAKVAPYTITNMIVDNVGNTAVAYTAIVAPFFAGQIALENNVFLLTLPTGNAFGYYTYFTSPYFYHYDLGSEYFIDANDGSSGAYLYDFTSRHFFYTNPSDFPYLYDFTLGAWLYYFPGPAGSNRYTSGPRYFYNFGTGHIITQ